MSTRCHVIFVDRIGEHDDAYITYVHSDGYPEGDYGIVARLLRFNKWLDEDKYWCKRFNGEYIAANWVYWCKKQKEEGSGLTLGYGFTAVVFDIDPLAVGGDNWGYVLEKLEPYLHGDIEYLYLVYPSRNRNDPMNWYVIIADYKGHVIEEGSLKELVSQFVTV